MTGSSLKWSLGGQFGTGQSVMSAANIALNPKKIGLVAIYF